MASPEAFTVIRDRLVANWTATPLAFENENAETDPSVAPLVVVEVFGSLVRQASIGAPGDNLWREQGQALIHVLVPQGTGTTAARTYAKQLGALFRETVVDGVRFGDQSVGAGESGNDEGAYWRLTLSVDFERDET